MGTENSFLHTATYSPEDDKIRIYTAERLPKEDWERFKSAGFTWTMKQESDLVAKWTPKREDLAIKYCGEILDHDMDSRLDRSADRAERFSGYRDKREAEARASYTSADTIGMQSQQKAEIKARKIERLQNKTAGQWGKAEYWQERTAGVIEHALYMEKPEVRHRRIKKIESELRITEKNKAEYMQRKEIIQKVIAENNQEMAEKCINAFNIWLGDRSLYSIAKEVGAMEALKKIRFHNCEGSDRWINHLNLRIGYENQMLKAQLGSLACEADWEKGGTIGKYVIHKINRSPKTKLINSISVLGECWYRKDKNGRPLKCLVNVSTEGMKADEYKAPTPESLKRLEEEKALLSEGKTEKPKLINPTIEEAQKIQDFWNQRIIESRKAYYAENNMKWTDEKEMNLKTEITVLTMAEYKKYSGGSYAPHQTEDFKSDWTRSMHYAREIAFKMRISSRNKASDNFYAPNSVIVISDKKQHKLPARVAEREAVNV